MYAESEVCNCLPIWFACVQIGMSWAFSLEVYWIIVKATVCIEENHTHPKPVSASQVRIITQRPKKKKIVTIVIVVLLQ